MKPQTKLVSMIRLGKKIILETGTLEQLEAERVFDEISPDEVTYFPIEKLEEITKMIIAMGGKYE